LAKTRVQFVCQSCGTVHARWAGQVRRLRRMEHHCGGRSDRRCRRRSRPVSRPQGPAVRSPACRARSRRAAHFETRVSELDRVTGGGFVRGSALLVGGDPGIGKSTLLMQAAAALARRATGSIYVSGEEAVAQVRLRAQRLGAADSGVLLAAETNVEDILATLAEGKRPRSSSSIPSRRCGANGGIGARHRHPGAHRRARHGALCQADRRRHGSGRPRHQGRADRRPPRGRAHGRCGALFRGR
jgi:predicted ATP-dependent serine protease